MKIIEALKKIKDLNKKADDLKLKIATYCADLDCETPTYPDQKRQVAEWLQAHGDVVKEILRLHYCIQKTNIMTQVSILLGDKSVTKSISEWILRRRTLASLQQSAWKALTDKNLKESYANQLTPNSPQAIIKRRLYYDPIERDRMIELYRSEPAIVDATLEVINATTELIE
jgi:hypothetical protein